MGSDSNRLNKNQIKYKDTISDEYTHSLIEKAYCQSHNTIRAYLSVYYTRNEKAWLMVHTGFNLEICRARSRGKMKGVIGVMRVMAISPPGI